MTNREFYANEIISKIPIAQIALLEFGINEKTNEIILCGKYEKTCMFCKFNSFLETCYNQRVEWLYAENKED